MARTTLKDPSGNPVLVNEGESAQTSFTFFDLLEDALPKSAFLSIEATLSNAADGSIINSRNGQSVLDANGGAVSVSGVLTLTLSVLDNVIVGSSGGVEIHHLDIEWAWNDALGATQTGIHEFEFSVAPEGYGADPGFLTTASAVRITRPARVRRRDILTLADAVDRLLRIEEINPSESRSVERAKLAVQSALNNFVSYSMQGFRYYDSRYSFNTSASIPISSVTVVDNVVTPLSLTVPAWMDMAHLRINGQSYPVMRYSASSFTVDGTLTNGTYTGCTLQRMFYELPSDFRRRGSFSDSVNQYPVIDVPGGVLQSWRDYYDWAMSQSSQRTFGSISNDQRFQGGLMLAIWPPYTTSVRLNLFYERYPASCQVHRVGTSTLSTLGTAVTSLSSVFKDDHVGSVLVIGENNDTDILASLSDLSLVHAKRIITAVTSGTEATIDQALDTDVATRSFYISDPVDVQPGAQTEAFLRLCEYEMCRQSRSKHTDERYRSFIEQLHLSQADDIRYREIVDDTESLSGGYLLGSVTGRPDRA